MGLSLVVFEFSHSFSLAGADGQLKTNTKWARGPGKRRCVCEETTATGIAEHEYISRNELNRSIKMRREKEGRYDQPSIIEHNCSGDCHEYTKAAEYAACS
jgi:hypothetical protein